MGEMAEQVCSFVDLSKDERNTYLVGAYVLISLSALVRIVMVIAALYVLGAAVLWANREYKRKGKPND